MCLRHQPLRQSNAFFEGSTDTHNCVSPTASLGLERRQLLVRSLMIITSTTAGTAAASLRSPERAVATLFPSDNSNRRQLELCLVAILRVLYWAQLQADALAVDGVDPSDDSERKRRLAYLEARLNAKAILTGKIGPGATGTTYTLATLQLPACLNDLEWHATQGSVRNGRVVSDLRREFSEAIASVVEFDGLETLIDPSPRSALTLSQYTTAKAIFVRRVLVEQVVPRGMKLVMQWGSEPLARSVAFTKQYYASEIPNSMPVSMIGVRNDQWS